MFFVIAPIPFPATVFTRPPQLPGMGRARVELRPSVEMLGGQEGVGAVAGSAHEYILHETKLIQKHVTTNGLSASPRNADIIAESPKQITPNNDIRRIKTFTSPPVFELANHPTTTLRRPNAFYFSTDIHVAVRHKSVKPNTCALCP